MEFILDDFVNRQEAIALIWQVARQELESRVLVVYGEEGIGKTYLLEEFLGECQKEKMRWVQLDFKDGVVEPAYMAVVMKVWERLGPEGFEPMASTIDRVLTEADPGEYQQTHPGIQAVRPEVGVTSAAVPGSAAPEGLGRSTGGLSFSGNTNIFGNVAGRDFYLFMQVVQRDVRYVKEWAQAQITTALRDCLAGITRQEPVAFLIDHWDEADAETRRWMSESLLRWAGDLDLPKVAVIITCSRENDIIQRRRTKRLQLKSLPEEAVTMYLVQKRGVHPDHLWKFELAAGKPILLAMLAEQYSRQ